MSYHYYQSKPGSNPQMQNTPKKNNGQDQKPGDKERKRRQKTTAIALSVLLVLTTMVVGYGMISSDQENTLETVASIAPNDKMIAFEETSRQQAEKIRTLKKQLFETNSKLYEYKSNLFAKGDPQEKAYLASLSNDLLEKSRATNEYAARIQELENQRAINNEKIDQLENTLTELIETSQIQKDNQEQTIQGYQNQIQELEAQWNREKEALSATVAELEKLKTENNELANELKAQSEVLVNELKAQSEVLVNELKAQYDAELETLKARSNELINELEAQYDAEIVFKQKIDEISAKFENEGKTNQALNETIESLLAAQAEKETLVQELKREKDEILQKHDALAQEHDALQKTLNSFVEANEAFSVEHEKMLSTVKKENENSANLKNELDDVLAKYAKAQQLTESLEEELQKTSQKVVSLQEEQSQLKETVASAQRELESQTNEYLATVNTLKNTIQNIENERMKKEDAEELKNSLHTASEAKKQGEQEIARLQSQLEQHATAKAAIERKLQEQSSEVSTIVHQLQQVTESLELEKLHTRELHTALNNTIASSEQYKPGASQHQDFELGALKKQLREANESLQREKQHNHELHAALNNAISMYDNQQIQTSTQPKQDNGGSIVFLQERLADLDKELARKNDEIAHLSEQLESKSGTLASTSSDEQQNTRKLKEEIQKNITEMTALLKVLSNKEEEILSLKTITNEQKRTINELTKNISNNGEWNNQ